jgi:hypothetical protein
MNVVMAVLRMHATAQNDAELSGTDSDVAHHIC